MADRKRYFLIADDDLDDQFMIQDVITTDCPSDIEAKFVDNGMELLDFLRNLDGTSGPPNLILLDLNMPRMDGRQALQEIKTDQAFAGIPVVILTTSQSEEDVAYCQGLGAAGFYQKPSSISGLREIISTLHQQYFP